MGYVLPRQLASKYAPSGAFFISAVNDVVAISANFQFASVFAIAS